MMSAYDDGQQNKCKTVERLINNREDKFDNFEMNRFDLFTLRFFADIYLEFLDNSWLVQVLSTHISALVLLSSIENLSSRD